jgi:hypothetical protein
VARNTSLENNEKHVASRTRGIGYQPKASRPTTEQPEEAQTGHHQLAPCQQTAERTSKLDTFCNLKPFSI